MNTVETDTTDVFELADRLAAQAAGARAGRAAHKVTGGPGTELTQTVIAMNAGTRLDEHENPGEATILILRGRAELGTDQEAWTVGLGGLMEIPPERHYLTALEDTVVVLTSVKQRSKTHEA